MSPKIAFAIAATAAALLSGCAPPAEPAEEVRPVRTLTVAPPAELLVAAYSGEIKARREDALGFQVGGRIRRRLVEVGDTVAAGAPLMELDPSDTALNASAYRAQVDAARAQLAQAKADAQRYEALAQKGYVGRSDLEKARLSVDTATQSLRAAEANHRVAANQAGYTVLRATAPGVITAIDAEAGRVVQAGQVVIHVAEDGERELVVSVPESRVDELRTARSLAVELWADPARRYQGRLRELAPDTDDVTRTYAARVSVLDADAALRLGMTAKLTVGLGVGEDLRRVPLTAILDTDGKPRVWIVTASMRVEARPVTLARAARDAVLVSQGLHDGDVVVTAGVHLLRDGQKVAPIVSTTVAER